MQAGLSTGADLRKAGRINSREIVAAIDAYMHNPMVASYRFSSGHNLDVGALVATTVSPVEVANRAGSQEKTFWNVVATAIIVARPLEP